MQCPRRPDQRISLILMIQGHTSFTSSWWISGKQVYPYTTSLQLASTSTSWWCSIRRKPVGCHSVLHHCHCGAWCIIAVSSRSFLFWGIGWKISLQDLQQVLDLQKSPRGLWYMTWADSPGYQALSIPVLSHLDTDVSMQIWERQCDCQHYLIPYQSWQQPLFLPIDEFNNCHKWQDR